MVTIDRENLEDPMTKMPFYRYKITIDSFSKKGSTLSLANIHKDSRFQDCDWIEIKTSQIHGTILGLLMLPKLIRLDYNNIPLTLNGIKLKNVLMIVDKYLYTKDIFGCKEELVAAGLKEFAKL